MITKIRSGSKTVTEAREDKRVLKFIQHSINEINERATSSIHKIRRWAILPIDFSVAGGELTPTMKLKRSNVLRKYKDQIDKIYYEAATKL